jgi:hypothetical protein
MENKPLVNSNTTHSRELEPGTFRLPDLKTKKMTREQSPKAFQKSEALIFCIKQPSFSSPTSGAITV